MTPTESTADPAGAPTSAPAPGGRVLTVTGEVPPDALGPVMPHEHLLSSFAPPVDTPGAWRALGRERPADGDPRARYEAPLGMDLLGEITLGAPNRDDLLLGDERLATDEAAAFGRAGGSTLVDLTTPDLGRDPAALRRISEATGLSVVMGSGRFHPAWRPASEALSAETLTEEIVRDLTEGVDGVRAGVIGEIPALDPRSPAQRAVLVAAARASAATGSAISLCRSPDPGTQRRVLDLLAEEGADLRRVALGRCDTLSPDPDALEPLLERGVFVQFDQLGRLPTVLSTNDDQDVAAAVLELARRGHAKRILLSQDVGAKSRLLAHGGGGYGFVLGQFVPYLRMLGADDALVETLTVRNPARLLTLPDRRTAS
ncbi:phosphotriesterase [Streptomyces sp. NPDC048001]|uniref:phosphotriesterase family protein n=1 Tax=Streptomyces sp. NPDC048001 TaxID=3365498 RepID=UPI003720DA24